jgi:tripartite-type tricarboxylate transporter receptor subunit TctC
MLHRSLLNSAIAVLLAGPLAAVAVAQSFPSQPVRIINAFPPGGGTDLVVRIFAEELRQHIGGAVVVENKPGANTVIALEEVYKAKPDGHTLFASNSTGTSALLLMRDKLSFNPDEKMVMVAPLADGPPSMHVANKNAPFNSWADMVTYAKANPGKVRYASPGQNSGPHLDVVLIGRKLGIDLVHIPQKGAGPMVQAVMNGDVHMASINIGSVGPQLKSGEAKPLAVNFPKRLRDYQNVPTIAEVGLEGFGIVLWHALWVHADTPKDIQAKIFDASQKALQSAKVREFYNKSEIIPAEVKGYGQVKGWEQPRVERIRKQAVEAGLLK